jgi:hypothetical protein
VKISNVKKAIMNITVDAVWLDLVMGTVLPIVVAIVKRRYGRVWVGAVLLAVLAAAEAVLREVMGANGRFDIKPVLIHFFLTFISGVAMHFGLLKPVGVTGDEGAVQRVIPAGIG